MTMSKPVKSKTGRASRIAHERLVSYAKAKNLKHLKDALGHLNSFKTAGLSVWNEMNVNTARCHLEVVILRLTGK